MFTLGLCELALLIKLQKPTKLWQSRMIQVYHDVPLYMLDFIPVDRIKFPPRDNKIRPVTEPARLPGSYQEALTPCRETTTWNFDSHVIRSCSLKLSQICVLVSVKEIIFFIVCSIFELGDTTKCLITASEFCFPATLNVLQSLHATLFNAGIVCKLPDTKNKNSKISHPHNQHCKGISAVEQGMYLETKQKGTGLLLSDKDWKGMDFLKLQL